VTPVSETKKGTAMTESEVSRRDVLKFSALGTAAMALPLERIVKAKTVRSQGPTAR